MVTKFCRIKGHHLPDPFPPSLPGAGPLPYGHDRSRNFLSLAALAKGMGA